MKPRKPGKDMIKGAIHKTLNCGELVICKFNSKSSVEVEFLLTGCKVNAHSGSIRLGSVKDPMKPFNFGVGFVGVGNHKTTVNGSRTRCYQVWRDMLERCYCPKSHKTRPTYKDCSVSDEWHNFQNFADWFQSNYKEGLQIDKDIIIDGNRVYSKDTCLFVTPKKNIEKALAKNYTFIDPEGNEVNIYNLSAFCRGRNISKKNMSAVHCGRQGSHKGWRAA